MTTILLSDAPDVVVVLAAPQPLNILLTAVGMPGASGTIVHVGPTPPPSPAPNDLWVDTS